MKHLTLILFLLCACGRSSDPGPTDATTDVLETEACVCTEVSECCDGCSAVFIHRTGFCDKGAGQCTQFGECKEHPEEPQDDVGGFYDSL